MAHLRAGQRGAIEDRRITSRARRRRPGPIHKLIIAPDGGQHWHPKIDDPRMIATPPVPGEIWVYLTDPRCRLHAAPMPQPSAWDFGQWLGEAAGQWADRRVLLHIVSFDLALRPSGAVDELSRLAGALTNWRVVLITDGKDLASTAMIDKVLSSCIDEVQVCPDGAGELSRQTRVLNAMKDLIDLRQARGQNLPRVIFRVCAAGQTLDALRQWSRQVGLDRLHVTNRATEEKRLWDLLPRSSGGPALPTPNE